MRMTDLLLTETPRPCLADPPFTEFHSLCPNPVVIDGTQVAALFMEMTMHNEVSGTKTPEQEAETALFESAMGEGAGWQMAQFFQFDFASLGVVAPPFDNFVIEFDMREAMVQAFATAGNEVLPHELLTVGKSAAAFSVLSRESWDQKVRHPGNDYISNLMPGAMSLKEMDALDFGWMYCVTTYRLVPGKPLAGPVSTWLIPVSKEGHVYISTDSFTTLAACALGPTTEYPEDRWLSKQYAITQGWACLLPALLSLSFLHTPRTTKKAEGYHDLVEAPEPPARMAKKYLQRNFRPLTKWHTLDITPLRRAVREANGGSMPTEWKGLMKALHTVRGHTATYMPNTYFGRKHERPITVFRPSYRRGDVKAGVIQKEYRLDAGEASA